MPLPEQEMNEMGRERERRGGGTVGRMADPATNGLQLLGRQRVLLSTNLIVRGYHRFFSETRKTAHAVM